MSNARVYGRSLIHDTLSSDFLSNLIDVTIGYELLKSYLDNVNNTIGRRCWFLPKLSNHFIASLIHRKAGATSQCNIQLPPHGAG